MFADYLQNQLVVYVDDNSVDSNWRRSHSKLFCSCFSDWLKFASNVTLYMYNLRKRNWNTGTWNHSRRSNTHQQRSRSNLIHAHTYKQFCSQRFLADASDTTFPFCLPQEKPCVTSSKKVYYFIGQKNRDFIQAITGPDVMLFYSDWNTNSQSHVDDCKLRCASVLAEEKNDMLRPVRFASRAFSPAESRWVTLH